MSKAKVLSSVCVALGFVTACSSLNHSSRNPASDGLPNALILEGSQGEHWKGGTRDTEIAGFQEDAAAVAKAFRQLAETSGTNPRVFHEKSHGCLTGTMRILPQPTELASQVSRGMFAEPGKEYPLIARFSNGVGKSQHDAMPDVRGVALKVFFDDRMGHPVDFLMTNQTNPFGRDQAQFVEFMKANMKGPIELIKFVRNQEKQDPREVNYIPHFIRSVAGVIKSPATERYWSGHPYAFGNDSFMKFNVAPEKDGVDQKERDAEVAKYEQSFYKSLSRTGATKMWIQNFFSRRLFSPTYLRSRLAQQAEKEQIKFIFSVQLYKNEATTPVENALVEWKEQDTPSIPVAEIILDQQQFNEAGRDRDCSQLRFSPGNFHPAHRPAANIGRGRVFTYLQSQNSRGATVQQPNSSIVGAWRGGSYTLPQ